MSNYQENYGQQYSNQGEFYESGLSMEDAAAPAPAYNEQQYPNPQGSYYSAPHAAQQAQVYNPGMYTQQGQGYTGTDPSGSYPTDSTQGMGPPGGDIDPGSMGQMASSGEYGGGDGYGESGFEEELPLLVELGIDFDLIKQKTLAVLNPLRQTDPRITNDTDLAGPLIFCLLFGVVLLMSGKVHFGYIYGVGLLGCSSMFAVLNLMSSIWVSVTTVVSVLGYCLLPMVFLSCFSIIVHLQGIIGVLLSMAVICWSSYSASKLFVSILPMDSMQLLVAYPCALLYGVFALLTVF